MRRQLRLVLIAFVALSGVVHALAPAGTDLDQVPAGLSDDDEAAWVFAHSPAIHVTP
ncbi:MAG: hypothetical protein Q8O67_01220 [Deltaproteobacteria bacterium]|nr:hypothetical protein [Deltaproteobacteria bacterium]